LPALKLALTIRLVKYNFQNRNIFCFISKSSSGFAAIKPETKPFNRDKGDEWDKSLKTRNLIFVLKPK
jgi:hypothetical protein